MGKELFCITASSHGGENSNGMRGGVYKAFHDDLIEGFLAEIYQQSVGFSVDNLCLNGFISKSVNSNTLLIFLEISMAFGKWVSDSCLQLFYQKCV